MFYKTYNSPVGKIYLTSDGKNLTALLFETSKDLMKYISNKKQKELPIQIPARLHFVLARN